MEHWLLTELGDAVLAGRIIRFLQPDALVIPADGEPFFIEGKGQEMFKAPPFDGHGLPVSQVEGYEEARHATGLRTLFTVYDGDTRYSAWLDELEQGEHFDTAGTIKTPRRIYPISGFTARTQEAA